MTGITRRLAELIVDTATGELPDDALGATERVLLDTLGCAAAGLTTEGGRHLTALKLRAGGAEEATLIGHRIRLPVAAASYVHAHAANLLDADETLHHKTHFACCVAMPALAVAESVDARGDELLAATAIGFDVAARVCLSFPFYDLTAPEEIRLVPACAVGYSPAALGTAAAAARLLGLDADQTEHALGLAYLSAPVRRAKSGRDRGMAKYTFYGPVAEAGVNAALLAKAGFTAEPGMLDAESEFWRAFGADSCDQETLLGDLGSRWYIAETSLKPYPSSRQSGAALDLFKRIVEQERWRAEDIDAVVLRFPPTGPVRHAAERTHPSTAIASQFSIPYAFAMIADQVPPSAWHAPERFEAPAWKAFVPKIRVEVKPEWQAAMVDELRALGTYRKVPTEVEVSAQGRSVSLFTDRLLGDPWSADTAFDRDAVAAKFRDFAAPLLGADRIEQAIVRTWALRDDGDVGSLVAALR